MKIQMLADVQVLKGIAEEGKDDKKYYRISVFDPENGEAGQINCTEEVIKKVNVGSMNTLVVEFNDKYNSLCAVSVLGGKK